MLIAITFCLSYRGGWIEGHRQCKQEWERINMVRNGIVIKNVQIKQCEKKKKTAIVWNCSKDLGKNSKNLKTCVFWDQLSVSDTAWK